MPFFVLVLLFVACPAAAAPQALAGGQAGSAQALPAAPAQAPPSTSSKDDGAAWTDIGFLTIDVGYQQANSGFTHTFSFPMYAEQANVDTRYPEKDGPTFNVSWTFRLWRNFAAGLAVSAVNAATSAPVTASIPHPVRLQAPRTATGSAGVERAETGVHLQLGYVRPAGKFLVAVTGGPSYFRVKQSLVDSVEAVESPGADTLALLPIQPSTKEETAIGFNVAADAAYYFTRWLGVGAVGRYSRGVVSFALAGETGTAATATTGGFQVAAGLRLRLPNSNTTKTPGRPPTKPVQPGPTRKPGKK